jgi:hypothetical protein
MTDSSSRLPSGRRRLPKPSPPLPERDSRGWNYIYHLICPVTHRVRYIGCTVDPEQRWKSHYGSRNCGKEKATSGWINWLAARDLLPIMQVVSGPLPPIKAYRQEARRIRDAKRRGWDGLLNSVAKLRN